ncbi:VOC family protein [Streptomyces sp. NPDC058239]|uniref:VOC family protein n=1 Tax=unclassified Streptomyces TaxID=2593676 RepID=UPI00364ABD92
MAVRDISHVELYTRDKVTTVRFLVSTMGFTRVADSVAVDRSSVLLRQGDVQLVVTSGWVTGKWLSEHRDGVADIALTCDDVTETARAALAAGARVTHSPQGNPVVSGWGGVSHTLLPDTTADSAVPPAGHKWTASPGATDEPVGRVRRLDHVAIRLEASRLADYAAFCTEVFGLSPVPVPRLAPGRQDVAPTVLRSTSERVAFALTAADAHPGAGAPAASPDPEWPMGAHRLAFLADDVLSGAREFRNPGMQRLRLQLVERGGPHGLGTADAGFTADTRSPVG